MNHVPTHPWGRGKATLIRGGVAVGLEQVAVPFNDYPGIGEDARKLLSEVAVGEEDPTHAARE